MLAHQIDQDSRTKDVVLVENITFDSLLLSQNVSKGLSQHGFKKPSPVQLKSIPLGRCGFDLIVKSKSGTGKTLVFSLIALETLSAKLKNLEVLILSPTREIAVQSHDVIKKIGCFFEGLKVESFIGGLPLAEDKQKCQQCNIAVGTPGRIKHLILDKTLNVNSVKLFVLDEADKLMESSFRNDINEIFNNLPIKKQIITTSATYPNQLEEFLSKYMLSPTHITAELESPLLLGLKQFVVITKQHSNAAQLLKTKTDELVNIFTNISFTQCLVFSNFQTKAESLSNILNQRGWPSTYISAAQTQAQRLEAVNVLKDFKCRIMLSTDLTARGIDAANVDLVINFDIPVDSMTYLHRMGRAGRYGSSGVCINLASQGTELIHLREILGQIGGNSLTIPKLPKINGTILDLVKIDVPVDDQISSLVKAERDESILNTKMYENKSDRKQKSKNNGNKDAKRPKNVDDEKATTSQGIEITEMLQNTQQEIEEVRKQISEMDTESILDSLLNQSLNLEIGSRDSNKTTSNKEFDAKAVLDVLNEGCTKTSTTKSDSDQQKIIPKTETEKELKEKLFTKNKALLSVSKLLSASSSVEESNCIEQHLNVLKSQFKSDINELSRNSVNDLLTIIKTTDNPNPNKIVDNPAQESSSSGNSVNDLLTIIKTTDNPNANKIVDNPAKESSSTLDVLSTSKTCNERGIETENLFELGYKHLVLTDDSEWKEILSKHCSNTPSYHRSDSEGCQEGEHTKQGKHRRRSAVQYKPSSQSDTPADRRTNFGYEDPKHAELRRRFLESEPYSNQTAYRFSSDFPSDPEGDTEVKHMKQGTQRRKSELGDESSNQSEPTIWSSNPEENSMLEMEWQRQEAAMRWIPVEKECYKEVAEAMDHIDDVSESRRQEQSMKWIEVKRPRPVNHFTPTCVVELRKSSDDFEYGHYTDYMEQLDDKLWHNGLEFNNSESFNEWFTFEWELELQATRSYIEQNIYVCEMSKFQK